VDHGDDFLDLVNRVAEVSGDGTLWPHLVELEKRATEFEERIGAGEDLSKVEYDLQKWDTWFCSGLSLDRRLGRVLKALTKVEARYYTLRSRLMHLHFELSMRDATRLLAELEKRAPTRDLSRRETSNKEKVQDPLEFIEHMKISSGVAVVKGALRGAHRSFWRYRGRKWLRWIVLHAIDVIVDLGLLTLVVAIAFRLLPPDWLWLLLSRVPLWILSRWWIRPWWSSVLYKWRRGILLKNVKDLFDAMIFTRCFEAALRKKARKDDDTQEADKHESTE
jgi:hypothetical protein